MSRIVRVGSIGLLGFTACSFTMACPSTNARGRFATADDEIKYSGPHSKWVQKLLSEAGEWRCPSDTGSDNGQPPNTGNVECQRDANVKAAVLYAWTAEILHQVRTI